MARQQDDVDLPVGYYSNVIVNSRNTDSYMLEYELRMLK